MKKNTKKSQRGGVRGMPSAVLLSILIHVGLFLLAGMLVVFTVVNKEEKKFIPPKAVERPRMQLRKPKVKVKTTVTPKATTRIVTKAKSAVMPDIKLPEMSSGIDEGLGGGLGGFDMMPDLAAISVFGNAQSIGNDFEGEVYSLVYDRDRGTVPMSGDQFREVLRKYVLSGWKDSVLARYYRLPKKLYSTYIMVPPIPTALAPGAFGAPGLNDYWLFVKYEGNLVYKEDIRFRFWGVGDAYIFVNVDGKEVLMSTWEAHKTYFDWWQSSAGGDRSYLLGNQRMVVGDWIDLKAGEPVDMKVLFGEWAGGYVAGMLLVEVDGVEYPHSRHNGPLLPIFKTAELSWDSLTEVSRFLAADECSLTNGPVFNDYYSGSSSPSAVAVDAPEPEAEPSAPAAAENAARRWTLVGGRSMEAEFMTEIAGNAILKNAKGKQIKIPMQRLSETDRSHVLLSIPPTLDINFSKTTKQYKFGGTIDGAAPPVRGQYYTFSARINKTSTRPYDFGLTAEFFAVGNEFGGNKKMLLDYQKADFTLTEENDYAFEFAGKPVELIDYNLNNERKGKKYSGFLVIVKDSRGKVIAYKTPSENLYRNLENLRKLHVGWYFDKQCVRCLPTPPTTFGVAIMNN